MAVTWPAIRIFDKGGFVRVEDPLVFFKSDKAFQFCMILPGILIYSFHFLATSPGSSKFKYLRIASGLAGDLIILVGRQFCLIRSPHGNVCCVYGLH